MRQHLVAILHSPAELATLAVALVITGATGVTVMEGGLNLPLTGSTSGQQAAVADPATQQDLVDAYVGGRSSARASLSGGWEHPTPARRPDSSTRLQDAAGVGAGEVPGAPGSPVDLSPWLPASATPLSTSPLVATAAGTPAPGEGATTPAAPSSTSTTPPADTPTDSATTEPTDTPTDSPTDTPTDIPTDTPTQTPPPPDPTEVPTPDATPDSAQTAEPDTQVTNDPVAAPDEPVQDGG